MITPLTFIFEVKIKHNNGLEETINTTAEHPFWIDGEGWRKASILEAGMKLLDKHGKPTATVVSQTALDKKDTVYNFEVQDFSTYHIGELGVWVHNANCCEIDKRTQKSVDKTISEAANDKISYTRGYHGRLKSSLEKDITSKPESVFLATNGNLIFLKDGNMVVTAGNGSNRGKLITSYGKSGPRGESGKAIFGGEAHDPGMPVTEEMIINGEIPRPNGSNLPPATKVKLFELIIIVLY